MSEPVSTQLAISPQPGLLDIADCSQVSEACSAGAVCLGLISEWCRSTGAVRPGLAAFGSVYGTG